MRAWTKKLALLSSATLLAACVRESVVVRAPDTKTATVPGTPAQEILLDKAYPLAIMEVRVAGRPHYVRIQIRSDSAPNTAANFIKNANAGFYDGLAFHRTIRNFLVQAGDPLTRDESQKDAWGTGGTANALPPETKLKNVRGSVVMARLDDASNPGKRSHATQFFVCLRDLPTLDGKYSVLGTVLSGMDVMDLIGDSIVDTNDVPIDRVEISRLRVVMTRRKPEVVGALGVTEDATGEISLEDSAFRPRPTQSEESGLRKFFRRLW